MKNENWFLSIFCSVLIILGLSLYAFGFNNEMFWDDDDFILNNGYVKDLKYFPNYFSENIIAGAGLVSNYYRPVLLTVFALEWKVFGDNPVGWHFVNAFTHSLNCVLLFMLLWKLFRKKWVFIPALIFLIHPLQTESVVYVNSFGDSLSVFFSFIGLHLVEYSLRAKNWSRVFGYFAASLCFVLAILSKETAIIFPALALLIIWFKSSGGFKKRIVNGIVYSVPFWILCFVYLGLRAGPLNFKNSFNLYDQPNAYSESIWIRVLTFFHALWVYVGLIFFPKTLHMERSLPYETSLFSLKVILGLAVLFVFGFLVVRFYKKKPEIVFGVFWFFIALGPVSNILVPINGMIYEHWLYVPIVGIGIIIGVVCSWLWKIFNAYRYSLVVLGVVIVLALSYRSYLRILEWKNPVTFFEQTLKFSPGNYRILNNLGMELSEDGKQNDAIARYKEAINLDYSNPVAHHNLGNIFASISKFTEAQKEYEVALNQDPKFIFSYLNLTNVYLAEEKYVEARQTLEKSLLHIKNRPEIYVYLAQIAEKQGDKEAVSRYLSQVKGN